MQKPALVIFDLDGTLLDTLGDITVSLNEALASFGFPTHPTAQPFINNGARRLVGDAIPAESRTDEMIDKVLAHYRNLYSASPQLLTKPYPGLADTLAALKKAGIKTAVFSNKDTPNVRFLTDREFPGLLDSVYGVQADIPPKPNTAGIDRIFAETGCDVSNTLYVGDSAVDMKTAAAAGLPMCGVNWGFSGHLPFVGTDIPTVNTTEELTAYILQD